MLVGDKKRQMSKEEFVPKGAEDVKADVISDLSLDADTQSELIEKITLERLDHQKTLGTAIRQKRDKADALGEMEKGKDFYKGKAGLKKPKGDEANKSNQQVGLSREEAILFSQGYLEEEVELATKLSKLNGTSLSKATEDDYFKGQVQIRKDKDAADKASLPASQGGGAPASQKDSGDMTREEHQTHVEAEMKKAGLN